jgi:hypothetical protein
MIWKQINSMDILRNARVLASINPMLSRVSASSSVSQIPPRLRLGSKVPSSNPPHYRATASECEKWTPNVAHSLCDKGTETKFRVSVLFKLHGQEGAKNVTRSTAFVQYGTNRLTGPCMDEARMRFHVRPRLLPRCQKIPVTQPYSKIGPSYNKSPASSTAGQG